MHPSTAGPSHIRIVYCRLDAGIAMGDRRSTLVNKCHKSSCLVFHGYPHDRGELVGVCVCV